MNSWRIIQILAGVGILVLAILLAIGTTDESLFIGMGVAEVACVGLFVVARKQDEKAAQLRREAEFRARTGG